LIGSIPPPPSPPYAPRAFPHTAPLSASRRPHPREAPTAPIAALPADPAAAPFPPAALSDVRVAGVGVVVAGGGGGGGSGGGGGGGGGGGRCASPNVTRTEA
jgi:hypothetical protein